MEELSLSAQPEVVPSARRAPGAEKKKRPKPIEVLRVKLLEKRKELRRRSETGAEWGGIIQGDEGDRSFASQTTEVHLNLASLESSSLAAVEYALWKMQNATYGECEACLKKIPVARLKAEPAAMTCIECQEDFEKGKIDLPERTIQFSEREDIPTESDNGDMPPLGTFRIE